MNETVRKESANTPAGVVRRMSASDVSDVLSILRESPEASLWSPKSLADWSSSGDAWVVERDGYVAGLLIARNAADEMEILNLAVAKASRRQGVASQLMNTALRYAWKEGVQNVHLELRASNAGGFAFYNGKGFEVCGRRADYYLDPTEDALLLVLHRPKEF